MWVGVTTDNKNKNSTAYGQLSLHRTDKKPWKFCNNVKLQLLGMFWHDVRMSTIDLFATGARKITRNNLGKHVKYIVNILFFTLLVFLCGNRRAQNVMRPQFA